jgi:prephenate dehydrogenase
MGKKEQPSVSIVGLCFVGTSIGLALQQEKGNYFVIGHDSNRDAADRARKMKAVDKTPWNLISACENSDLVILAIPFKEVRSTMEALAGEMKPGAMLVDLSTVKKPVRKWAEELLLPRGVGYIGADLIPPASAAPEPSARAFEHGTMAICTMPDTSDIPLKLLSTLADRMGMKVLFMSEDEHDSLRAATTHLPMLLGASYLNVTAGHEAWRELRRLAGGEFKSVTGTVEDPEEAVALLRANWQHVKRWLDIYLQVVEKWAEAMDEGKEESLALALQELASSRDEWLGASISGRWEERQTPEIPKEGIMSRLFGIHTKQKR